jgi:protein-disulfide isomerase
MKKSEILRAGVTIAPLMVGLAASASMLVDYLRPAPVFCDPGGGCGAVRQTAFAAFLGIPTPAWGLAGFVVMGAFAVTRGKLARAGFGLTALLAALVALLLLGVQAKLGQFCPYCVATDSSALLLAGVALHRLVASWDPPELRALRVSSVVALGLAIVLPLGLSRFLKPAVPSVIAAELDKTPPGKITVVDFVDFECPFCRETHAEFTPVLARHKDKLRIVRKHVPLSRIHPHAMEAARAACCGEALGKGDELAELLMATPAKDLTAEGCAKLAAQAGLDPARFEGCLKDPSTDARIQSDSDAFRASGGHGLPTIWVDREKLEGAQDEASLEDAVSRAVGS